MVPFKSMELTDKAQGGHMSEVVKSIEYMQGFGLGHSFVANAVGLTPQHVGTIARTKTDPKFSTAMKIIKLAEAVKEFEKAVNEIRKQ